MSHNLKKQSGPVKKIKKKFRGTALTFHLVQFPSVNGKPLATLQGLQKLLSKQRIQAGDWLVFPEMWPSGFDLKDEIRLKAENPLCLSWLKEFAKKHRCYLVGSMLEMEGDKKFNSAYIIGPQGKRLSNYRKIHLFKLGKEHRKYHPGDLIVLHEEKWGKIGLAICFDLRFPELFRKMSKDGVEVMIIPSAWPTERLDHFLTLLKARAIENLCYTVGVNKVGKGGDSFPVVFGGHSAAFDPWGKKLGELGEKTGILTITLDLNLIQKTREQYPFLECRVLS